MITTIVVAHHILKNTHCSGYGGGDHDPEPEMPHWLTLLIVTVVGLLVSMIISIVCLSAIYTEQLPDYQVPGQIVRYSHEQRNRSVKVFVQLQQPDGKVRKYNTGVKAGACQYAKLGSELPVTVSTRHNTVLNTWNYTSTLNYNPCK